MSHDPLDYQLLLQDALRGLVRRSLEIVAEQGFTGDHHFYLSFRTGAPGVEMPPHLRDTYPDEMTIVLKTQFKDLTVTPQEFSVGLFFSGVLYYLTVPFDAVIAFADPSADFQVGFQPIGAGTSETMESGPQEVVPVAVPVAEDVAEDSVAEDPVAEDPAVDEADPEAEDSAEEAPIDNVVSFSGFRKK